MDEKKGRILKDEEDTVTAIYSGNYIQGGKHIFTCNVFYSANTTEKWIYGFMSASDPVTFTVTLQQLNFDGSKKSIMFLFPGRSSTYLLYIYMCVCVF